MAAAKKDTGTTSKKDFMEQLASFIEKEKKTETKSTETKEVITEESLETEESEEVVEEFGAALDINLMDLNNLINQPVEVKIEASLLGEAVELSAEEMPVNTESLELPSIDQLQGVIEGSEIETEELVFKVENQLNENMASVSEETSGVIEPLEDAQVSNLLQEIETQLSENPELEVKDVVEGLLFEKDIELDKKLKNIDLEAIEKILQDKPESIVTGIKPNLSDTQIPEVKEMQDEGIDAGLSIEQTEVATESKDSELGLESEVETQTIELSAVETFEPVNRMNLATETSTPIQSVAQEDFISNIETLMIEETESLDGGDKVTTARIQLTPERLGKVDLQIEMNGKELTAKLFVEQKETKEWIDQQVAHLKVKLLTQEITLKDFQVVVHEENLNDAFMNSEDNPFFKQKEKDSQARKEQRLSRNKAAEVPVQREERSYSTRSGISILV